MTHHLSWLDFGLQEPFSLHGAIRHRPLSFLLSGRGGLAGSQSRGGGLRGHSGALAAFLDRHGPGYSAQSWRRGSSRRSARDGSHGKDHADGRSGRRRGDRDDGDYESSIPAGMVRDADGNLVERLTPRQERLAAQLEELYRKHGQDDKVPQVEKLIRLWAGREAELLRRAREKYEALAQAEEDAKLFRRRKSCSVCFEFSDPHSDYSHGKVCVHPEFNDGDHGAAAAGLGTSARFKSPSASTTPSRPSWR